MSIGLFLNRAALASQLDDWQLVPQPERYTELYFTDHRSLPISIAAGAKQNFPFTVHNREHNTVTYHYNIAAGITEEATGTLLEEGIVTLDHDRSQTIDSAITLPPLGKRIVLKVTLQYQSIGSGDKHLSLQTQSIHHWMNMTSVKRQQGQS